MRMRYYLISQPDALQCFKNEGTNNKYIYVYIIGLLCEFTHTGLHGALHISIRLNLNTDFIYLGESAHISHFDLDSFYVVFH